ncbi:dTMP kinase [Campylobacter sp. MIT 99-7217]|uniref:dTMP kinase n=1 Tax=Campylobacter sp. MIT 99-7217 TaxID=535091 RepID=UPI00115C14C8|nr:dTMP kinase [Campylobacter sp. MIT 99-7217]TQR34446.1 dTMP kinase [Campylobacter sp. MIT 99-7217]
MYVALEGIDGVGKSTQIELLKRNFKEAIFCFEPGNTALGEKLREILLESRLQICKNAELLLFLADRAQHFEEVIKPNSHELIITDRSLISNLAYAKDFDMNFVLELNSFVLKGFLPHKCVFLEANEKLILQRFQGRNLDKIEQRGIGYFLELQNRFKEVLELLKTRFHLEFLIINADNEKEKIYNKIKEFIND